MEPYALISMDINMPDINGPEVVKKMRQIEQLLGVPAVKQAKILMATTERDLKHVSLSYYDGCDGYLTKPATAEDVKKALKELGIIT